MFVVLFGVCLRKLSYLLMGDHGGLEWGENVAQSWQLAQISICADSLVVFFSCPLGDTVYSSMLLRLALSTNLNFKSCMFWLGVAWGSGVCTGKESTSISELPLTNLWGTIRGQLSLMVRWLYGLVSNYFFKTDLKSNMQLVSASIPRNEGIHGLLPLPSLHQTKG